MSRLLRKRPSFDGQSRHARPDIDGQNGFLPEGSDILPEESDFYAAPPADGKSWSCRATVWLSPLMPKRYLHLILSFKKQVLQAADTELFIPLVPNARNCVKMYYSF